MDQAAVFLLMYAVFPAWVAAGFLDWVCHRRTGIAVTTGLKENLLHWLMYAEVGAGMLAVVFLELDAAVLAIVVVVFLLHEATVYWDLDFSTMRRDVGPAEQMVHSFLELLPLVSLALLAVIAWPQALAIFHAGPDGADWSLRLRAAPVASTYLVAAFGASVLFNAIPMLIETASCLRATPQAPRAHARERVEPKL